ncbi:MAG TPA: M28 family metallopeptidase [Chitinophagaceae bacterium]
MRKFMLATLALLSLPALAQTTIHRDPEIAAMVGAVSADSLRSYINSMVSFGNRNTLSAQSGSRGIGPAREWVLAKFRQFAAGSSGRLSAYIDTTTLPADNRRVNKPTMLGNVIAVLKGTDVNDKRIFMISGHLDSRASDVMNTTTDAPGANDDGSGVAAVLESARVMSRYEFPATVIFVAFSGEEQGLLGANFLAGKAQREGWNVEALLNNDIMGSNNSSETRIIDNTRVRVFSESFSVSDTGRAIANIRNLGLENDGKARQLARYVKEIGERYVDQLEVVMIYRNDRFLRGGDHTPFVQRGFAAVRVTEMNENYEHQHQDIRTENGVRYGDLAEFMDFEYLRKNTAMNVSVLANLASAPGMPADVKVETRNLTNSTTLNWSPPAAGKAKGYYVLVRETTSPVWQRKYFTTETRFTLPYSKDNYFFAVQSVSESGNESIPVVPAVAR